MKISIVGPGAMGSLFGELLAQSGNEVTLIDVNDAHIDPVRTQGLRLAADGSDRQVTTLKTARPEYAVGLPDLLTVFTKTLQTQCGPGRGATSYRSRRACAVTAERLG